MAGVPEKLRNCFSWCFINEQGVPKGVRLVTDAKNDFNRIRVNSIWRKVIIFIKKQIVICGFGTGFLAAKLDLWDF